MPSPRWTEREIAALHILYPDLTVSREEMEVYFGRTWDTIKSQARQRKIYRHSRRSLGSEHWTAEEETLLREMYPDENIPREEIASKLGRTWRAIQHKIGALGLGLLRPRNNTTGVQRDYFHVIDTDEKAYWLGFLAADGVVYISGRQHSVRLDLQPRDLHWLTRFRDTVAPGMKITQHGSRSYSFGIGSQEMVADLIALGITPRKSNTLEWPNVPETFITPFLLGYFDGDGSLVRRARRTEQYQWHLLGTLAFLNQAREHIYNLSGIEFKPPIRAHKFTSPHLYLLYTSGPRVFALDRWLNGSGLGLPRKHLPPSAD